MSVMEPALPAATDAPVAAAAARAHAGVGRPDVGLPTRRITDDLAMRDPAWAEVETHVLDVHGTDVLLRRHRPTPTGVGRTPHLLVHGLGASSRVWLDAMPLLADDAEVLAVDLPGFGRTAPPAPEAARIEHQVRFLGALLRRLGWDRVVLHGSSMGGLVTALFAAQHPGLVERQVLVAPGLAPPTRRMRNTSGLTYARFVPFIAPPLGRRVLQAAWHRDDVERTHDRMAAVTFGDIERRRPAVRDLAIDNLRLARELEWRIPSFTHAARSLMTHWIRATSTWQRVLAATVPTTVVWGTEDRVVDASVVEGLEAGLLDVVAHRLDGIGHVPMLECPQRYVELALAGRRARVAVP